MQIFMLSGILGIQRYFHRNLSMTIHKVGIQDFAEKILETLCFQTNPSGLNMVVRTI
jgi:hypothetical protein